MADKVLTIALAGNPNAGKTTIFNALTGTRQKVGNWPGVTVEKKEGLIDRHAHTIKIVDLPGTYSLTPYSIEEIVARNYILDEAPDVVIDIIDASNIERSLYLATQIRELDCKVVFALNMADQAHGWGLKIDAQKLSELLDLPVVFTVGNKNKGIDDLLKVAVELANSPDRSKERKVRYSQEIEKAIGSLQENLISEAGDLLPYDPRWTAIKLLEDDTIVKERLVAASEGKHEAILKTAQQKREQLKAFYKEDPEIVTTDERYGFISGIVKEVVATSTFQRVDTSRSIDLVLTNRYLGMPIFFFFIWGMFQLTFTLGEYPQQWIEMGAGRVAEVVGILMPQGMIKDLITDGIIQGVGTVLVFLPNILLLFFCIALFEDTGYMARSAFLMDKIMHLVGLHGKSFIPMLMGFGCNVPAIMATRTLESKNDRILTILITPFMSCSAKLPVYIVLAGGFFGARAGSVIFCIYIAGIILSIITGRLFRSTFFKSGDAPFVMELPPYRMPMAKSLMIHMWDRSKLFLKRMGGIILIGSIIIWVLANFPRSMEAERQYQTQASALATHYAAALNKTPEDQRTAILAQKEEALSQLAQTKKAQQAAESVLGHIGKALAPVFKPLGIDWRGGIALVSGFVAKEIVVSTLGVLHAADNAHNEFSLQKALRSSDMTPLSALAMMVFVLLYLPCLATIAAIRRETGSVKWMMLGIGYNTAVAWLLAFVVYQGGKLLGFS